MSPSKLWRDSNGHPVVIRRGNETNWHQPGFFGHAFHLDGTIACDGEFTYEQTRPH